MFPNLSVTLGPISAVAPLVPQRVRKYTEEGVRIPRRKSVRSENFSSYLNLFVQTLRRYWDWTQDSRDSETFLNSPVFHPTLGFGSFPAASRSGQASPLDVGNGPFASYMLSYGPRGVVSNHRLTRAFNSTLLPYLRTALVSNTTRQSTFETFRVELEGGPMTPRVKIHDAGHRIIGGDMGDTYASFGDPLFVLHHSNLDRIWDSWQRADPQRRMSDISGRSTTDPPYEDITLDFSLETDELAQRVRIGDVMDTQGGVLCYRYV
ncbi:hypothetical protein DXG03_004427 [Asterophora parasitica]|uniref:Tyrosinase copper-binding domain-containing protein n=1 Tax=Asterophora parasitica TaxID=117018 RepID=A0A9P7G6J2_9AGAR|nr:hypothetical protein DXG03_004427 [Asterophora parasitica]